MKYKNILYTFLIREVSLHAQTMIWFIDTYWQFRQQGTISWYNATVPGEVHTDLQNNKLIPDPYFRDHEKKLEWIEKENGDYTTSFFVTAAFSKQKQMEFVFGGLDPYATVYLNGKEIIKTNNMFCQWRVAVEKAIKSGKNKRFVVFQITQQVVDSPIKKDLPYIIPDHPRVCTRKARYHFGWDWRFKLTTCGIWKAVRLEVSYKKDVSKPYSPMHTIVLVQQPYSIGKSFYFEIDGILISMKGANHILMGTLLSRVIGKDYEEIMVMAKEAHRNRLRVWGSGIYENDYFYDLCD